MPSVHRLANRPTPSTSNSDLATAGPGSRRDAVPTLHSPSTSNVPDSLLEPYLLVLLRSPWMLHEGVLTVVVQLLEVVVLVHVVVESNLF